MTACFPRIKEVCEGQRKARFESVNHGFGFDFEKWSSGLVERRDCFVNWCEGFDNDFVVMGKEKCFVLKERTVTETDSFARIVH